MIPASRILAPALLALAATVGPAAGLAQGTLRGRVIDSEMGTPLAGATVRIATAAPWSRRTPPGCSRRKM